MAAFKLFCSCTKLTVLYNIDIDALENIPVQIELPPMGIEPRTSYLAFRDCSD